MTKEALKLALEALETPWNAPYVNGCDLALGKKVKAITAIKETLAQSEHGWTPERIAGMARLKEAQDKKLAQSEQEPVAWRAKNFYENQEGWFYAEWHQDGLTPQVAELLYTTPPQRTWVGLTDEEIRLQWSEFWEAECHPWAIDFAKAIEAKLKEKNNG